MLLLVALSPLVFWIVAVFVRDPTGSVDFVDHNHNQH